MLILFTTEVIAKGNHAATGIHLPCGEFHGLQNKLILDIALTDLGQFRQLSLQPLACTTLDENQHKKQDGCHTTYTPNGICHKGVSNIGI